MLKSMWLPITILTLLTIFSSCLDEKGTFTDKRDGQTYKTVKMGKQVWMAENLNYYTNSGSWYYKNDSNSYASTYGRLYDWETACTSCPDGWHLPTDEEWTTLTDELNGKNVAGSKMKETGFTHGDSLNTGAKNSTGFAVLPGGHRESEGSFYHLSYTATFWTATEYDISKAWYLALYYNEEYVTRYRYDKNSGFSVRCVKD